MNWKYKQQKVFISTACLLDMNTKGVHIRSYSAFERNKQQEK